MTSIGNAKFVEAGELPIEQVSQILRQSIAGIFDYAAHLWSKSGIFAAYCAHGLVPVCMSPASGDTGITKNMYLLAGDNHFNGDLSRRIASIAGEANRWYRNHSRSISAERMAALLAGEQIETRVI